MTANIELVAAIDRMLAVTQSQTLSCEIKDRVALDQFVRQLSYLRDVAANSDLVCFVYAKQYETFINTKTIIDIFSSSKQTRHLLLKDITIVDKFIDQWCTACEKCINI